MQRGLSLVEIMISLVISAILMIGVFQVFMASKSTYRMNDGLARIQENGRFAQEILSREIRMAGYMGCSNLEEISPNVLADPPPPEELDFSMENAISGEDNVNNKLFGEKAVRDGTDVLMIQRAGDDEIRLTGNMGVENANVQIQQNVISIEAGDILLLSDCGTADIFRASGVSSGGSKITIAHAKNTNISQFLSKAYGSDAQIMVPQITRFFIADNEAGEPALYQKRVLGLGGGQEQDAQELIAGVEDMQVLYGVDSNDDKSANRYINAADVADWRKVVSVRVAWLMRSDLGSNPDGRTATYPVLDKSVTPESDRRLRRVFSLTATIRNRLPRE